MQGHGDEQILNGFAGVMLEAAPINLNVNVKECASLPASASQPDPTGPAEPRGERAPISRRACCPSPVHSGGVLRDSRSRDLRDLRDYEDLDQGCQNGLGA